MNLNSRAVFLIAPVILLSYAIAVVSLYFFQVESFKKQEVNVAKTQLQDLRASYIHFYDYAKLGIFFVEQSKNFKSYIREDNIQLRSYLLTNGLDKIILNFSKGRPDVLFFSIIDNGNEIYQYRDNRDPFARDAEWKSKTQKFIIDNKLQEYQRLYEDKEGIFHLIFARHIHKATFDVPAKHQMKQSVLLFMSEEMKSFSVLKKEIEKIYQAPIFIEKSTTKQEINSSLEQTITVKIDGGYYLYLKIPDSYFSQKLEYLQVLLLSVFFIMSLTSIMALFWLIKKHITQPIRELEKNIHSVIKKEIKEIIPLNTNDELGRLSKTFKDLHFKLENAYENSIKIAETDSLTGLFNRTKFNSVANNLVKRAHVEKESITFMFIDLDNFKYVNDNFGHRTGDDLLIEFARRLQVLFDYGFNKKNISTSISRLAGDEFAIIITNCNKNLSKTIAQRIIYLFDDGFRLKNSNLPVTVSIGISLYPHDGKNISSLLKKADESMYQAKIQGKNQYSFYSPLLAQKTHRRTAIESSLAQADFNEEFSLSYMPVVDSQLQHVIGVEALLRWHSRLLGSVPSEEFITIAEKNGYFADIDRWVINKAFEDFYKLRCFYGDHIRLSINLSSAELASQSIIKYIQGKVLEHEIIPQFITFEITETFEIVQSKDVLDALSSIKKLGFSLAIDDFGKGHTSLLQMIEYPVDLIKIDKNFMETLYENNELDLTSNLIRLCHARGMKITTEGIESESQINFMKKCGSDYFQGYYLGHPQPLTYIERNYIEKGNNLKRFTA